MPNNTEDNVEEFRPWCSTLTLYRLQLNDLTVKRRDYKTMSTLMLQDQIRPKLIIMVPAHYITLNTELIGGRDAAPYLKILEKKTVKGGRRPVTFNF